MEETGKYNKEQLKNHQNLWLEQAVYKFEWGQHVSLIKTFWAAKDGTNFFD